MRGVGIEHLVMLGFDFNLKYLAKTKFVQTMCEWDSEDMDERNPEWMEPDGRYMEQEGPKAWRTLIHKGSIIEQTDK